MRSLYYLSNGIILCFWQNITLFIFADSVLVYSTHLLGLFIALLTLIRLVYETYTKHINKKRGRG